jgi:hypothetical protein
MLAEGADTLGMSMHEVICSTCGAINQAGADICWRCLASIGMASAAADTESTGGTKSTGGTTTVTRPKA